MPNKNILIDGNNLLHRAQAVFVDYRVKRGDPPILSPDGYPTGLIQGTLSLLSDWIPSISRPTRIIFFTDGAASRRKALDPGYKARETREFGSGPKPIRLEDGYEAKDDLDVIDHLLRLLGVDLCLGPDDEADDLIASFIHPRKDEINFIVSGDKDFYQLLDDNTIQYRPDAEGSRFYDAERAAGNMGVPPCHVRMFKSLKGDKSDTYKGIPRIRSTVAARLSKHPDPASMYASDLSFCSKLELQRLMELRPRVELNFLLAGMCTDIDLEPFIRPATQDWDTARRILKSLGVIGVDPNSFRTKHEGREIHAISVITNLFD